jgi:hypothetical protein
MSSFDCLIMRTQIRFCGLFCIIIVVDDDTLSMEELMVLEVD